MSSRQTIALLLAAVLALAAGQSSAQSPTMKLAMRDKLAIAHRLLEGVIKADYAAIEKQTDALSWISDTEIASWQTSAQPEYVKQASLFLLSVKGLREAAQSKDIDAVTGEYTTLVTSCVQCHAIIRHSRRASVPPTRSIVPAPRRSASVP